MASYYVKSGAGATEFAQSTAYTSGQKIVPKRTDTGTNHLVAKRYVWECTTNGTTAGAEPTWPASVTADTTTVTSNTAVFTARKPGYSSGTTADWTFATIYMDYVGSLAVAGDVVYISNNHAESVGTLWGITNANPLLTGVNYICVSDAAAPPTAVATTATVTTTGAFNLVVGTGNSYVYGVTFVCGATDTATRTLTVSGIHENCSFQIGSTGASSTIAATGYWKDCSVKFAAAGQAITSNGGAFVWRDGSLLAGGTSPTSLFSNAASLLVDDVDLSNAAATVNLMATASALLDATFIHCKMPAAWSGSLNSTVATTIAKATLASCDNSGTNYVYRKKNNGGEAFSETTLVRTGGASDGTTGLSHKLVSSALAQFPYLCVDTPEIVKWNETTGSAITVTVEILHDSATALKNDEIYLEVSYYSEAGSPLGAVVSSAKASYLTASADTTASAATWTTTGMANPNPRKLAVTFTPQLKGFVHARVILAKASTTAYVDPLLTVS